VSSRGRSSGRKCPPPLTVVISTPGISMRSCSRSTGRAQSWSPQMRRTGFRCAHSPWSRLPSSRHFGAGSRIRGNARSDSRQDTFLSEAPGNAVRIGNAAAKHRVHDE
jgi:hypothetical protein